MCPVYFHPSDNHSFHGGHEGLLPGNTDQAPDTWLMIGMNINISNYIIIVEKRNKNWVDRLLGGKLLVAFAAENRPLFLKNKLKGTTLSWRVVPHEACFLFY